MRIRIPKYLSLCMATQVLKDQIRHSFNKDCDMKNGDDEEEMWKC